MEERKKVERKILTGERVLFGANQMELTDCIFENGESPLKESSNLVLRGDMFRWKYPLWYAKHITAEDCTWFETARAGVWYTQDMRIQNAVIEAPKNFRRSSGLVFENVTFTNAAETLWNCTDISLEAVLAKGDYFAMNCENVRANNLTIAGNYPFEGAKKCGNPSCKTDFQGRILEL